MLVGAKNRLKDIKENGGMRYLWGTLRHSNTCLASSSRTVHKSRKQLERPKLLP